MNVPPSYNWHKFDPVYKDVEWVEHVDWCPCQECEIMRQEVEADRKKSKLPVDTRQQ